MDRNPQIKHMEDFCQLTERLTERKYFGSYEQIAKKIRLYSSTGGADVIRFFEVVLYSFLIGNSDMHLKNFSLLREDNSAWHLADAIDALAANIESVLAESQLTDEFADRFNKYVKRNIEKMC